jgi:hypothetical protein
MATKPQLSPQGPGPQHFMPPSARELRAQAVHRLQIGLIGLAAMLLLVGLANIIMDRARLADGAAAAENSDATHEAKATNNDPLADMGVIPSPDASEVRPHRTTGGTNH